MKTATIENRKTAAYPAVRYPNAATRRQLLGKILDAVLVAACGAGLGACLLLFLAFC